MATGWYIGIDGKARKVKAAYVGVDGKARKVKAGYVGVDGKARKFYTGRFVFVHTIETGNWSSHTLTYDGEFLERGENIPIQFTAVSSSYPTDDIVTRYMYLYEEIFSPILRPSYEIYINGQEGQLTVGLWETGDVVECTLDTINGRIYFTFEEVI